MAIRCTAIRMSLGGWAHEHIIRIFWIQDGTFVEQSSTRDEMVAFVESGGAAYVRDAAGDVAYLGVWVSVLGNKYVKTYADGIWNDNLLALPRR